MEREILQRERHEPEYAILLAVIALAAIGILMVYSSSALRAYIREDDALAIVGPQILWGAIGIGVISLVERYGRRAQADWRPSRSRFFARLSAMRVIQPAKRVVYFLTGEGEADPEDTGDNGLSQAVNLLKRQNYEIRPLNLQITGTMSLSSAAKLGATPASALRRRCAGRGARPGPRA